MFLEPLQGLKIAYFQGFWQVFEAEFDKNDEKPHMAKIEFSHFRKVRNLSSRVTGVIWEVYRGKYFFFKIPTNLGTKNVDFLVEKQDFAPPGRNILPFQGV